MLPSRPPPFHSHQLPATTKLPTYLPTCLPTNASEEKQQKHKHPPNLNPTRQKKTPQLKSSESSLPISHLVSSSSQLAGGSQKKNTHIDNQNSHTTIDKRKEVRGDRPAYGEIGPLEKKILKRRGDEKNEMEHVGNPPARYVRE